MRIEYSAFILPHIGDKFSQCADRFGYSEANQCFAIADGVGNSLFPGDWATLLCQDYIEHPMLFSDGSHLVREDELMAKWEEKRSQRILNLTENEKFIYDMGLDKADFAASTFVGLSLNDKGWTCQAIGDSYLFVVNKSFEIVEKVASMDGRDFGNFPEYLGSKKGQNNGTIIRRGGTYEDVAFLVLMTDALSDWFIETTPEKRKHLLSISNHEGFEAIVDKERQQKSLKDDDTTMVMIKLIDDDNDGISIIKRHTDEYDTFVSQESNAELSVSQDCDKSTEKESEESLHSKRIEEIAQDIACFQSYGKKTKRRFLNAAFKKLIEHIKYLLDYGTSH